MKLKAFATLGVAAALVLPFGIASANAETSVETVSVAQDAVVASPDAVLVTDSPVVGTVAAPAPEPAPVVVSEPVAVQAPELVAVTTAPAPTPVATTAVKAPAPEPAPTAVVAPEPVPTTTAPAVVAEVPAAITENPVCVGKNLFTVSADGTCAATPLGYTVADLRADALFELNSRNPMDTAEQSTLDAFEATYVGGGSRQQPGMHTIHSVAIPGVVYSFK